MQHRLEMNPECAYLSNDLLWCKMVGDFHYCSSMVWDCIILYLEFLSTIIDHLGVFMFLPGDVGFFPLP